MPAWLHAHVTLLWWLGLLSIVTFFGTLIAIPILVARIPQDYFWCDRDDPRREQYRHPILRLLGQVLKNAFGLVFVLAGLAMLVLPGQGILTMLIGITLMDFPGKRALERRVVQQPVVLNAVNWMRAKAGKPSLMLSEPTVNPFEREPHG